MSTEEGSAFFAVRDESDDADDEDVEFAEAEGDYGDTEDPVVVFWVSRAGSEGGACCLAVFSPCCSVCSEPDVVDDAWDDEIEEDDYGSAEGH